MCISLDLKGAHTQCPNLKKISAGDSIFVLKKIFETFFFCFFFPQLLKDRFTGVLEVLYASKALTLSADRFSVLQGILLTTHNWKRSMSNIKILTCITYNPSNKNYSCGVWKPYVYKKTTKTHNCIFITSIINSSNDLYFIFHTYHF